MQNTILAFGGSMLAVACVVMLIFSIRMAFHAISKFIKNIKGSFARHFFDKKEDPNYLEVFTTDGRLREDVFLTGSEEAIK